jgi:hypothetical protein
MAAKCPENIHDTDYLSQAQGGPIRCGNFREKDMNDGGETASSHRSRNLKLANENLAATPLDFVLR